MATTKKYELEKKEHRNIAKIFIKKSTHKVIQKIKVKLVPYCVIKSFTYNWNLSSFLGYFKPKIKKIGLLVFALNLFQLLTNFRKPFLLTT